MLIRKLFCMLLSLLMLSTLAAMAEGDVLCHVCGQTAEQMHRVSSTTDTHTLSCTCGNQFEQPHAWGEWRNTGDGQHERNCTAGCWAFEHCSGGEATCTNAAVCTSCNTAYGTPDSEAHAWDEGAITQAATCRTPGVYTYTCSHDTAHQYTEELPIDPEAHFFRAGVITQHPTCQTEGVLSFTCLYSASHVVTESIPVDAEAHRWDEGVVTQLSTCVDAGVRVFTCLENPEHTRTEALPLDMTAHVWGERVLTRTATCEDAGKITLHCSRDASHTGIETIPAIGHNWSMHTTILQPTCTERGLTRYTCQNDSTHTREESTPARGHNWGNMTIVREATCTTPGEKAYTCLNDSSHTTTVRIPTVSTAHTYVATEQEVSISGPCRDGKAQVHICECGTETTVVLSSPSHHVFAAWKDKGDYHTATCTRCGDYTAKVLCHDTISSPCPICVDRTLQLSSIYGVAGTNSQGAEMTIGTSGGGGLMFILLYQQQEDNVPVAVLPTDDMMLTISHAQLRSLLDPATDSITLRAIDILGEPDFKAIRRSNGIELSSVDDSVLLRAVLNMQGASTDALACRVEGNDIIFSLERSYWGDASEGVTIRFNLSEP